MRVSGPRRKWEREEQRERQGKAREEGTAQHGAPPLGQAQYCRGKGKSRKAQQDGGLGPGTWDGEVREREGSQASAPHPD